MKFALVKAEELEAVCGLYRRAAEDMEARGLRQWHWGEYPREESLRADVENGRLYAAYQNGAPACAFALTREQEPEYATVAWRYGVKPMALHRVAVEPRCGGHGLAREAVAFAEAEALRLGCDVLRADTCSLNERAQALFAASMDRRAGQVYFPQGHYTRDVPYYCYESRLSCQTPLLPIPMRPAYRYGDSTPWGGCRLKELYHKEIPDPRTGEALEISAIPGLNSVDPMGTPLGELLTLDEEALAGPDGAGTFPLLLKLLDAHDTLSVQVHPDDAYAGAHENGKLGKSEAWVILSAEPDAAILYGIKPGVTRQALQAAVDAAQPLDELIRRVPVKAGDVFYIQSGMVHAIGPGIVLYEIQQSSDVTYRFWDYNRVNAKGEKRPLHLAQAMDVVDVALAGQRAELPTEAGLREVLRVPAFTLLCACVAGKLALPEHGSSFRMLTALDALTLMWQGGELPLAAGRSVLIPALCPALTLAGEGRALISQLG